MNIPQEFEDVFHGVELTEDEIRTLTWVTGWEHRTVENLRSAIQKAQATALSTLQAKNAQLRKDLEWKDKVIQLAQREERKAKAELEQVKREWDAAVRQVALISQPNEPLTLEQLREMDGEPVWIVEHPDWGHWELSADAEDYIADRDQDLYGLKHDDPAGQCGLHVLGWLAYRRPPEGENHHG